VVQETITLKQVLEVMDTGDAFSIAFVTDDIERKTGGEWIEVREVRKFEYLTKKEQAKLDKVQPKAGIQKNPNHYENSTRNIIFTNGEIRTIAIRLIRRFDEPGVKNLFENGKIVM
jgi:hypothetical protein